MSRYSVVKVNGGHAVADSHYNSRKPGRPVMVNAQGDALDVTNPDDDGYTRLTAAEAQELADTLGQ
jgi:hypothetical protein